MDVFRQSALWVVDFRHDGRARQWLKALPVGTDAWQAMAAQLEDFYGARARLEAVRPATEDEERRYRQGELPQNALCPTGRLPRESRGEPPVGG